MNVLLEVNPLLHRERTGIPTYLDQLCRRFLTEPNGDRFTLWGPDLDADPYADLPPHGFIGRRLFPRAVLERLWDVSRVQAVPRSFDLYHVPFPAIPAPRGRDTRLVVTVHDVAFARWPETVLDPVYLRYLTRCFSAQAEWADHFITDSHSTARDLSELLDVPPERITVAHLGTDLRPPVPGDSGEAAFRALGLPPRYILSLGTWEPRKNLPSVLRAFQRIRALCRDRDVRLVMAGGARWKYQDADRLIAELGIAEQIHLAGFVPREALPWLYARAELFVYPSLYEGFGLPPLEAMTCGTPVVTSNVSSLPEVAGDAALLTAPRDLDALAAAMERLLTDPGFRAERVQRGLRQASRFSWDVTARVTREVYRKVVPSS